MGTILDPDVSVSVEYDSHGRRVVKTFEKAYLARRFYTKKDKAGKNPAVRKPKAEAHAAIYLRVSTSAQDTASQEPDLHRWMEAHAGQSVVYTDTASGKSMQRPGWEKLADAMRSGLVSQVVVWRLDRLGRTASGLTALFDELRERRVNLVSLRDGLDLSTPAGRLMANVLASVAQFETEVRGERVRAGQAVARAKGRRIGGSKPGRRKVKPRIVRAIRELKASGETITEIAYLLGLSRPTVYDVLKHEAAPESAA